MQILDFCFLQIFRTKFRNISSDSERNRTGDFADRDGTPCFYTQLNSSDATLT